MEVDKSTQMLTARDSRLSALLFLSVYDFVSKQLMELRRKVDTSDLSGMKFLCHRKWQTIIHSNIGACIW